MKMQSIYSNIICPHKRSVALAEYGILSYWVAGCKRDIYFVKAWVNYPAGVVDWHAHRNQKKRWWY